MDKLKKNAFWAGTAGALVLLLILYFVLVGGNIPRHGKLERDVRKKKTDLAGATTPAEESIKQWLDRKTAMLGSYKKVTEFYAASDRHLERWFDGVDGRDRGTFMARYREEIQKLEEALTSRKTEIGIADETNPAVRRFGFNWEEPLPDQWATIIQGGAGEEARVLKELQKRFWARQRVANAIQKEGLKVTRVHDFRFFRRLSPNLREAGWEQMPAAGNVVFWPGVKTEQAGQMPRNFQEYELPNELGKTFTFGFALVLPYTEVPRVLKEILNPDIEPRNDSGSDRLLVNLLGVQVSLREQNKPIIPYWYYAGDEEHRKKQREKAFADAGVSDVLPRDVLLAVTCQIVDFEPAKVKKLELDPPAPPEATPKN